MNEIKSPAAMTASLRHVGTRPVRPDGVPKVTGAARYGADYSPPGLLTGAVLRSPHPHARILAIDTARAAAHPGVFAVMTGADLPDFPFRFVGPERMQRNAWYDVRNILAREKVYYEGHAVAAVAAQDEATARAALKLIDVDYEVLPFVVTIDAAIAEDAPLLHEDAFTRNVAPKPAKPSNISRVYEDRMGDTEAGFAEADVIVEHSFSSDPVHQGYIEPHACVAEYNGGKAHLWVSSQGHFQMRDLTAAFTGMSSGDIRVTPAEIGGGFGGKTKVYLEPVAMILSRKSGRPVKMVMTRSEVFRATGPGSDSKVRVKLGARKDGSITAAEIELYYGAGAFPGSPFMNGCLCAFAHYAIPNQHVKGHDVVTNRAMTCAYRAPGSPQSNFAVESVVDMVARKLEMDPIEIRLKNAIRKGDPLIGGRVMTHEGFVTMLERLRAHPAYQRDPGPNRGRGVAAGFWHNAGGDSGATVFVNTDGTVSVATGSPDIGGSRASMAIMAADTFGVPYEQVHSDVHDTASVPFTYVTGGSRVTFATGKAVVSASEKVITQLKERAAKIWGVDPDAVDWVDGEARPSSSNVGEFEPLSLKSLAAQATATGGHFGASHAENMTGHAPGLSAMFCDVEVDPETGHTRVVTFVAAQDAGQAIHPSYVEGQIQGAVVQGIGWALNEGYVFGPDGVLQNAGWLDYRMPVASDLPMIEAVVVEVPNPNHPFGVKGVAEAGMVAAMGCVANAIRDASGRRMTSLPISPVKLLEAIETRTDPDL
ncbi:xanthine dehydrogenase family protein molybdopterin-binding subunit [Antarctobacter sp.]|uniref:xanthine dehydrogenase family protein molybdopterin-binding subunit n=1 Tax=Antarctobacter sp. TaxID=1872577 RepID=UPI003A95886D